MIYFIKEQGLGAIKIGYTTYPETYKARFITLQISNPHKLSMLGTMPGDLEDEQVLHERFANNHIRGEWFKPSESLLEFIKTRVGKDKKPILSKPIVHNTIIKSEWKVTNKKQPKEELIIYTDTRYHTTQDILRALPFDSADNVSVKGIELHQNQA